MSPVTHRPRFLRLPSPSQRGAPPPELFRGRLLPVRGPWLAGGFPSPTPPPPARSPSPRSQPSPPPQPAATQRAHRGPPRGRTGQGGGGGGAGVKTVPRA